MSDPREDDLRATYDEVSSQLESIAKTEAEKQVTKPGTEQHVRLARKAWQQAERLRESTAVEAELAGELHDDPGPRPD